MKFDKLLDSKLKPKLIDEQKKMKQTLIQKSKRTTLKCEIKQCIYLLKNDKFNKRSKEHKRLLEVAITAGYVDPVTKRILKEK